MKLKIALVFVAILVVLVGFVFIRPMNPANVLMNNHTCPVSGNHVNGVDTYLYKGKEYNLCSDKCRKPLSENPEKYLTE